MHLVYMHQGETFENELTFYLDHSTIREKKSVQIIAWRAFLGNIIPFNLNTFSKIIIFCAENYPLIFPYKISFRQHVAFLVF